jgi:hypothetical protein
MGAQTITVFRFTYAKDGRAISPRHMWGTREAIAALPHCGVVDGSDRQVLGELVDPAGFYFEQADSLYIRIEQQGH